MKKSIGPQTIAYPTPVFVVGSYDRNGRPNAMTAAWAGITCSKPPALGISLRQDRYSYANITERRAFTVSIPSETYVREADYFGIVSGKQTDKFADTGLTAVRSELVDAPYVGEFPLILECRLLQTVAIGVHDMFIGQIVDVKVEEQSLNSEGGPDIEKVRPLIFAPGNRAYFGVGPYVEKAFSAGKKIKG